MKERGFTLVELIMVIVLAGILAASLTVFMKPAIDAYFDSRRRADLIDMADIALRQMTRDIRRAIPNSVIRHTASCLQLVPSIAGGRFRTEADPDTSGSAPLNTSLPVISFDVLTPMGDTAKAGDWVVIDNQNGSEVYSGESRASIANITPSSAASALYHHRVTLSSSKQFHAGYTGSRLMLVANAEQSVFYHCVGGRLYRTVGSFSDGASLCSTIGSAIVATDVEACIFDYETGATQQSALVWLQLQLRRSDERVTLAHGAHLDNVP